MTELVLDGDPEYIDLGCEEARCGHPQDGPGHPKKGWVRVAVAGSRFRWFCGWYCLSKFALRRALRDGR